MYGRPHTMIHPRLLWQHAITARTLYTLRHGELDTTESI
jgi:hypothetical protein